MAKVTQAQLRFLDKVICTTRCGCDNIGEFRTRATCERNGWLRHEPDPRGHGYVMRTYITDKARAVIAAQTEG